MEKGLHLPPHRGDRRCIDSLAQQVEHIPFKDGVLGSSPRRITGVHMNKKAKAFHSWTDPQWKVFFRVFLFLHQGKKRKRKEDQGLCRGRGSLAGYQANLAGVPDAPPRVSRPACDFGGTYGGTRPRLAGIWRASRRRGSS